MASKADDIENQLLGPAGPDGKRGWPQLGDREGNAERRSIVDALARIIQQNNFAIAQNDRIEKAQARIEAKLNGTVVK